MAEKNADAGKAEKKGMNAGFLMQIVFAIINLGVVGGGAFLVYSSTLGWRSPSMTEKSLRRPASVKAEAKPAEAAAGPEAEASNEHDLSTFLQKLDKFTVNLGGEPKRTIRLEVNLEMLNEESYEESMDATRMPKIRDRIVGVLNDRSFSELESLQGKLFLKEKIATEVNSILEKGVVKDVYFSEFVVQ